MAVIPTYSRQQGIPATTGVPDPPVVTISDDVEREAEVFFQKLGKEGVALTAAQTITEMAAAETNAMLKLSTLEAQLAKEDGLVAPTLYDSGVSGKYDGAQKIYEDAASSLTTPAAQRLFKDKFAGMAVRSRISVTTAGVTRKYGELKADMITTNDVQVNLIGLPGITPRMRKSITDTVIKNVNEGIAAGFIGAVEGAKMKIKLRSTIAKNGIAAWINSTSKADLEGVYDQMDTGKFTGPNKTQNKNDWGELTELEKESIRQRTARELESLQRLRDKQDRANEKKDKGRPGEPVW